MTIWKRCSAVCPRFCYWRTFCLHFLHLTYILTAVAVAVVCD